MGDLAQQNFSRCYGVRRSHKEALELVVDWLWRRQIAIAGGPRREEPLLEADLEEALKAPVAKQYYGKRGRE